MSEVTPEMRETISEDAFYAAMHEVRALSENTGRAFLAAYFAALAVQADDGGTPSSFAREVDAINAGYRAMLANTRLPDDFDAARTIVLAALDVAVPNDERNDSVIRSDDGGDDIEIPYGDPLDASRTPESETDNEREEK